MLISGLQKTTLLDFPGRVAATIFTPGCNFRCPFCHNMNLVTGPDAVSAYSSEEILSFLKKRSGILDGICITGGEPTLQLDLMDFISSVKSLGYAVKLDTNGSNPAVIKSLLDCKLIDYIAMDIKSSPATYATVCSVPGLNFQPINESVELLKNSSIDYEFRTTVVKQYHTAKTFKDIGLYLKGARKYYLQSFTDSENVPDHTLGSYSKEELSDFRDLLLEYIPIVELRGID